jgi:hypothetical protein
MTDIDAVSPATSPLPSKTEIIRRLERMEMSADAKAILRDLASVTLEVGGKIVQAGRHILAFVLDIVRQFPNLTFGAIIAYVVSALVASVPLLGMVLGPLVGPLLFAFGITVGALADMRERELHVRYGYLERQFQMMTARG